MAEKSEEVVSSNSFSTQMLWSISLFRVYKSDFFLGGGGGEETNGPYSTALSSGKRLFDEQFEGKHKFI